MTSVSLWTPHFHMRFLLRMKEAMLSLVSVMVIETEVVAVLPDAIPRRSWALTTTTYWLLVSRSRVFILQLITPGRDGDRFGQTGGVLSPRWVLTHTHSLQEHIENSWKTKHRPVMLSISKADWSSIKEYLSSPLAVLGSSASVALTSTTLVPVFERRHKTASL